MARKIEEGEFSHGAGHLTEVWATIHNPPQHAARYRAAQAAKERTRGGGGGDPDWRTRDDNMGGWRDSIKALSQHPPTPPVEPWDCNIEEEQAAAVAAGTSTTTGEDEEEEENCETRANFGPKPSLMKWG